MKPKIKITAQAVFKKQAAMIRPEQKPILRHTFIGTDVHSAELLKAGSCTVDGVNLLFHDIRVYLDDSKVER